MEKQNRQGFVDEIDETLKIKIVVNKVHKNFTCYNKPVQLNIDKWCVPVGGMMSLIVKSKTEDSVNCEVVDGGELKSRRHLNVRGKSATLPSITGETS